MCGAKPDDQVALPLSTHSASWSRMNIIIRQLLSSFGATVAFAPVDTLASALWWVKPLAVSFLSGSCPLLCRKARCTIRPVAYRLIIFLLKLSKYL